MNFATDFDLEKIDQIVRNNYISISNRYFSDDVVAWKISFSGSAAPQHHLHNMTVIHRKNKYLFVKIQ